MTELDRGLIMSNPRCGLSTPYRLTIRNSDRQVHHVLFNMGDLHLILPAPNSLDAGFWHFDNVATINIDDVLTEHGGLLHVLSLTVHLYFFQY